MRIHHLLLSVAPIVFASAAWAETKASDQPTEKSVGATEKAPASSGKFSTGVAKGRDLLDTAISASTLDENDIRSITPRSLAEIFRAIPGVRAEVGNGEGNADIAIRGLQIASTGAKFLQLQEDGLPVLEFGDKPFSGADLFLRADINVSRIEAIRGGSAATFASNSPGGVINLISKTGEVEGGAVQLSGGVNYDEARIDFDYGGKINDTLRFHAGGFYRQGEGPRRMGYDAYKGGQFKVNLTKEFTGGYIRFYGKYLDDKTPGYADTPILITGNGNTLQFASLPGFEFGKDALGSRYRPTNITLDGNNNVVVNDARSGQHPIVKSFGVETRFELGEWTVTERFRFEDISGRVMVTYPALIDSADNLAAMFGGPGATLAYATGPNAGQAITNPAALNGNGLLAGILIGDLKINSYDNITNEVRASRVWNIGSGKLTTTAGFYKSLQAHDTEFSYNTVLTDVRGGGNSALVNIIDGSGTAVTDGGYLAYNGAGIPPTKTRVDYHTNAAFGSLNYLIGKVAIGGSVRYDFGSAKGSVFGAALGGTRVGFGPRDMNGDGVISPLEQAVGIIPLAEPGAVNYSYNYLSYSVSVNYRASQALAFFSRYSKGARVNSDRFLFSSFINEADGSLTDKSALIDYVREAEAGVKYRSGGMTLNLTGFLVKSLEHNQFYSGPLNRKYKSKGAEFEGSYSTGPLSVWATATYTDSEIAFDSLDPTVIGNEPGTQPKLFGQIRAQADVGKFSAGTQVFGVVKRYAQDDNLQKIPGYITVNPFVTYRPTERLLVSLNANNVFDARGIVSVAQSGGSVATAQGINGRTISGSVRYDF